ncbi:TBC1 domain family member 10B-like [Osmerus eperlanus]|uniref:TBC1 domain family member 10B-like n=1 Tax=Osmerus eperlanus TaxID=29151 RepID=UPI002E10E2DE
MAEISTLTPSPSALGDPHASAPTPLSSTALPAPSSPAPESTKVAPTPKSSLYALMGAPSASPMGQAPETHAQETPQKEPKPLLPDVALESPALPLIDEDVPQRDGLRGMGIEREGTPGFAAPREGSDPAGWEMINAPTEPSVLVPSKPVAQVAVEQTSPPPDLNPSPNLYPSVHVTQTLNPTTGDAQSVLSPPPAPAAPPAPPAPAAPAPTPPPPDPTQTIAAPASATGPAPASATGPAPASATGPVSGPVAEDEKPLPPQEGDNPQPQSPIQCQLPNTPTPFKGSEPPNSPSRGVPPSPPVLVIQEPAPPFSLPNSQPRPALDSLSYLESASMMSGTLESLSGLGEDGSSVGSDSEVNGQAVRRTDKYGFLGGNQYSEDGEKDLRIDVARQREMKWLDMFNNWDKWVSRRFQKVKLRCRKGIPSSLRAKAWQLLSNSKQLLDENPGKFEELEREPGDPKWLDIIEKDLHRQFPFHEMFAARGGHGQQDLYRILKAYTVYRPDEGYCQAQAPVAAVLLMHMPAEQAFWCLVQICEKYLPGYYSAGLEAIQLDGEIFFSLLRRVCPMAYRHLKKFKIDPILYMTEWFMCVFSRTLPWACVLRVWDMFFCEGVKIVFRVGLVLLKQMLGSVDKLRELQGMYETMERLRNIPPESIREDLLVHEVVSMEVTEALIERECSVQVRKWRESRGELTHQPSRRLHGTRAIHEHKRRAASISSGGSFSFLGASIPPPGPLRASSSLLSLPGFRKSKLPFRSQPKKGSFSGGSGMEALPPQHPSVAASSPSRAPIHTPPPPMSAAGTKARAPQSPLAVPSPGSASAPAQALPASSAPAQPGAPALTQQPQPPRLSPSSMVVSEQITPTLPSPTANNAVLPPRPDGGRGAAAGEEEDGKKKKRSKEDKKKEKEEEKQKLKERKEKEKSEKERQRKEKERAEKEKKKEKGGKKKDKVGGGGGGGEAEENNGGAAPRDSA